MRLQKLGKLIDTVFFDIMPYIIFMLGFAIFLPVVINSNLTDPNSDELLKIITQMLTGIFFILCSFGLKIFK